MSKKQYTMPIARQVRYFKSSRDNWRKKAGEKQARIRVLEQKVRDLKESREKWKSKAKESEERIKELEKKQSKELKTREETQGNCQIIKVPSHHYCLTTIKISIQQVILGRNSYRAVEMNLQLLSEDFEIGSPHFSSIRKWVARLGLYELNRPKPLRDDWIFLVDLTLELGQEKAMVVYGLSQENYQKISHQEKRALRYTDGEILLMEVLSKATGEVIKEKLELLSQTVGIPQQILGDHGSNLKKGISLYQEEHPDVVYTYDVTHAMSNLLKHQLATDEVYQEFLEDCHYCRLQIQQTELSFLTPPRQRSQCRYFNVERLVEWANQLLKSPLDVIFQLIPDHNPEEISQRLKEKFTWLAYYEEPLKKWRKMVFLTRSLEKQVKIDGFHQQSVEDFESQISSVSLSSELLEFKEKILQYLHQQINRLKTDTEPSFLATTDILESLFGKYKEFSARCPLKELRQMLLTIPLSTMNLTSDIIQKALETIGGNALEKWLNETFNPSMLSKRKTLFAQSRTT